jgi:hypothetical protein
MQTHQQIKYDLLFSSSSLLFLIVSCSFSFYLPLSIYTFILLHFLHLFIFLLVLLVFLIIQHNSALRISVPPHSVSQTSGSLFGTRGWLLEIENAADWLNWHAGNTNLGLPLSHMNVMWSGLIREELCAIISRALTWELIELELSPASQPQLSANCQYYLQLQTDVRPSTF